MRTALPRRDLLRWASLIGLGAALPGLTSCSAAPAEAELAISGVPRQAPGEARPSTLGPFAARLLDALRPGNEVISPFSVAVVLAMIRNGAVGATGTEFDTVLGSDGARLNAELNTLLQVLAGAGSRNGLQLTVANAVWAQRDLAWEPAFLDALARWYGAGVRQVDFRASSAAVVAAINGWANQATKGLIPTIVDDSMINPNTRMALGNAIHFKGSWKDQFVPALTTTQPFTTGGGARVSAPMMADSRTVPWLETPLWTGAALPFSGGELAMALLLPRPGAATGLAALTADRGFADLLAARPAEVALTVPRWKARTNVQLEQPLGALGLRTAFDRDRADFAAMTRAERLFLAFVVHEATITVDETGAEAAAVTVGGMELTSGPGKVNVLRLDRPFYWAIAHVPTSSLLFLGHVDDPTR